MSVRRNMAARPDRRAENLRRSIVFSGLSAFLLPVKKVNTTTRRETEVRGNMSGSMLLLQVFVPIVSRIAMLNITKMKERKVRDWYVGIVILFSLLCAAFFSVRGKYLEYRAQL